MPNQPTTLVYKNDSGFLWTDYNLDLDILDSTDPPSQELGDPRSSSEGTTVNDGTTWSDGWTGTVMSGYNYTEIF